VWVLLALITLAATALRFPFLGHQSLWVDEVFTRHVVEASTPAGVWHRVWLTESTPPLYYLLSWLVGAHSVVATRVVSAVALTAAVPVGYLAFRGLIGRWAALAAAAILAVSPELVSLGTYARSYGLFILTVLLSIWGLAAVLERGSGLRYGLWAIACVACVWTHYFGAFLIAAEAAVLLAVRPGAWLRTVVASMGTALTTIPLVPLAIHQANAPHHFDSIIGIPLGTRLSSSVDQFAMGSNVPRSWLQTIGTVLLWLGIAVGAALAVSAVRRQRRPGRAPAVSPARRRWQPGAAALLVLAAVAFGAPLASSALGISDRFDGRNVLAALPPLIALAAPAMIRLRAVPLASYLGAATLASLWVATDWHYESRDWRAALAQATAIDPGAALIAQVAPTRVALDESRIVRAYIDRRPKWSGRLLAQRVWIVSEPLDTRGVHGLAPAAEPRSLAAGMPGFRVIRELSVHDFRLAQLAADGPLRIKRMKPPYAVLFPGGGSRLMASNGCYSPAVASSGRATPLCSAASRTACATPSCTFWSSASGIS
jgi:4-amino-4-deoxy-L-arabinose transferase-like glycosyltransferase